MDYLDLERMVADGGRVCADSRLVGSGDVFVAVRGVHVDGYDCIGQALERGAGVIVAERGDVDTGGRPLVVVADSAVTLGELAQVSAGRPTQKLITLGVTGTNGKTTVTYLVQAMLRMAGIKCGLLGTVVYDFGAGCEQARETTPGAVKLAEMMGRMVENGCGAVVMECSSHALDQRRTAGIHFQGAAFTNLTGDHLDYHGTSENYLRAKARLFEGLGEGSHAVLNAMDVVADDLAACTAGQVCRYGLGEGYDISAEILGMDISGTQLAIRQAAQEIETKLRLIGEHNVMNCLAAVGLARAAGVELVDISRAIKGLAGVPGRLERVDCKADFTVLVDYAHTDDALDHALATVKKLCKGRVIVVFGCGGERDRSKRPRMAAAAEKWADVIVLTNDNPRREDPRAIAAEVMEGFNQPGHVKQILDRRDAIGYALQAARKDDVVLVAGKGHEPYQEIGGERFDFDDKVIVGEYF